MSPSVVASGNDLANFANATEISSLARRERHTARALRGLQSTCLSVGR